METGEQVRVKVDYFSIFNPSHCYAKANEVVIIIIIILGGIAIVEGKRERFPILITELKPK